MAFVKNTAFAPYVTNSERNDTQNITGLFGSFSGDVFTPEDCSAGTICVQAGRLPLLGYEQYGRKNGNSHYMVVAPNGTVAGHPGDHTGLYALDTHDVFSVTGGGLTFNVPGKTLGVGAPAGERQNYIELIVGEMYVTGNGNFTTLPSSTLKYAKVVNGFWVAQENAATNGEVYVEMLDPGDVDIRFIEGVYDAGTQQIFRVLRAKGQGGSKG